MYICGKITLVNTRKLFRKLDLGINLIVIFIAFLLPSCNIQNRRYNSGFYVERNHHIAQPLIPIRIRDTDSRLANTQQKNIEKPDSFLENTLSVSLENTVQPFVTERASSPFTIRSVQTLALADSTKPCQKLIMNNGNEISAMILEISSTEIRYKRCENPSGPDYVLPKSLIFLVQYGDGTNKIISPKPAPKSYDKDRSVEPMGVIGSVLALVGVFAFGIPLGLVAMALGSLSLDKIKRNPEKHRGKGWAIASISLGALSALGAYIAILLIL
jgi:hypothetical protein